MKGQINYNGKVFQAIQNIGGGDVDSNTIFFYHQKDDYLWGHYEGGSLTIGVIIGKVMEDSSLKFSYWHFDSEGKLNGGFCHSIPKFKDGTLYLHESWYWTQGRDGRGTSIIKEINQE